VNKGPLELTGRALLHYRVDEKIGEGGMGVVYKARDTHLDRFVAIKVLPPDRIADPERRRRFVQEAKAASALRHPNIVTIHDIAEESGVAFIVMEYVPGKPLSRLIPRKGLRMSEALKYAVQIADALAAAHAAGIIHRDLKPANIMADDNGAIKVLDFGLAKLTEEPESKPADASTGTVEPETEKGTIVGTVSYMSPEQAEARRVDARSDIFSFGSVLYEMLTGRRAFEAESRLSTLSKILTKEPPPLRSVVQHTPPELERIIHRCLRKDINRRWHSLLDVKVALQEVEEQIASDPASGSASFQRRRGWPRAWTLVLAGAVLLLGGVAGLFWWLWSSKTESKLAGPIPLTTYRGRELQPSFSPDGNQVAFSWDGEKQDNRDVYVKLIGTPGPPLRLTTDPRPEWSPAWSPDGRWIAFCRMFADERADVLVIPALGGGPERKITEVHGAPSPETFMMYRSGVAWSRDGSYLAFSDKANPAEPWGLFLVSVESGERLRLTSPPHEATGDFAPAFAPNGKAIAFVRESTWGVRDLFLLPFNGAPATLREPRRLTTGNLPRHAAWSADGRDLISSSGSMGSSSALWRVHANGSAPAERLPFGENGNFPAISPQTGRLAYARAHEDQSIWRVELGNPEGSVSNATSAIPLIQSTRIEHNAQYSPDGKRIVFASDRSGNYEIWVCNADGTNQIPLTLLGAHSNTPRWSPDGERIVFDSNKEGNFDIYIIPARGGKPMRLTTNPTRDSNPSYSRDGKWIYFASDRGGDLQVWKVPAAGGKEEQVTTKGGFVAFEALDGRTLYYMKSATRDLWSMPSGGGEERRFVELVYDRAFSVAENGVYFKAMPSSIAFVNFATNKTKTIYTTDKLYGLGLSISADGRWILCSQLDNQESDLMLVEHFR
jgi:eukaryotic-like serine/threonine-protein kinase